MSSLHLRREKHLLKQARTLRSQVQQNIRAYSFPDDDLHMRTYNDLIMAASELFFDDPILNGQMVKMPDAVVQMHSPEYGGWLPLETMPLELPSQRTEQHLTRLINRVELLLGEESAQRPVDEGERGEHEKKSYAEGSLLHYVVLSLDKIKKLSKSELISEKLQAFNIIIFIFLVSFIITHLIIGADPLLSLASLFIFALSLFLSFLASVPYAYLLEAIVNLAEDKIGSLRIGAIILLIGLPIASAGLAFNATVLIEIALGIIALQIVFMLLGALVGFPNLGIKDKKVKPSSFREVIGDVASVLMIIDFIITVVLIIIGKS